MALILVSLLSLQSTMDFVDFELNPVAAPEDMICFYSWVKSLIIIFRQKNKEQRENVIGELVTTEREYCRDLKLTWQAFSLETPEVLEQKQIDVKGIFL